MRHQLWPFIVGKVVFSVVLLAVCNAILLGGGGLAFGIHWQRPGALAALALGYCGFAAALFSVLVALVPDERRAAALNTIAGMALGCAGGCAFPPEQLPAFLRDYITPLLPSFWFVDAARSLQLGQHAAWGLATIKLAAAAVVLVAVAAALFRRKFSTGLRP
jgi:ABC-type polysaccharide/polyol phosphate export permease